MLKKILDGGKIIIVTGHFGSGKTNFAVNLAMKAASEGRNATLVDLDIVNPYFRAADNRSELEGLGVETIIPTFANTNVDIPVLPAEVNRAFEAYEREPDRITIFDVGGDNGAVALGMYRQRIENIGYEMLYIVNRYRPLTETIEDAAELLYEIEGCCGLKMSGIVNTSNLGEETTAKNVRESIEWAGELSEKCRLPLVCTAAVSGVCGQLAGLDDIFPIEDITKKLWK